MNISLFSRLRIRSIELRNRIVVSPMCMYSSEDGFANDWHLVHLGSRAVGRAGLVFTEATAVSPEGRISPGDLGIWKDEHIDFLKRITTFISAQGAIAGIQLAHAGRKASMHISWKGKGPVMPSEGGWKPVAPSAVAFKMDDLIPLEMDQPAIDKVLADFRSAAKRALQAGFRVVEIHAAHGYLLHEFLSPLSNKRSDRYGGSFENRIRFLLEIVKSIREEWPKELPLFVRISATDWVEGGWTEADSIRLSKLLKENEVDLIDCSTGGNVPDVKIPIGPLYQLQFAKNIRKNAAIMTGAVGLITTPGEAEGIIEKEEADLVFLAREFLRDPYFPLTAARVLEHDIEWPVQYERAKKRHK